MSDIYVTLQPATINVTLSPATINVRFPVSTVGPGVPTGGTTGQVLTKQSSTNYDTAWADAASLSLSYYIPAGQNLSSGRAVMIDGGEAYYFQPSNTAHAGRMAGITRTSANEGNNVEIRAFGVIEDASLSFLPDKTLWVGTDGAITDTQSGYWLVLQKSGISMENDKMLIDFSVSILK